MENGIKWDSSKFYFLVFITSIARKHSSVPTSPNTENTSQSIIQSDAAVVGYLVINSGFDQSNPHNNKLATTLNVF